MLTPRANLQVRSASPLLALFLCTGQYDTGECGDYNVYQLNQCYSLKGTPYFDNLRTAWDVPPGKKCTFYGSVPFSCP